jgi:hypothetical protein
MHAIAKFFPASIHPQAANNGQGGIAIPSIFARALLTIGIFFSVTAMATEEPKFKLISRDGDVEIRLYDAFIVAETVVDGDMDDASSKGFRLIADFIFGNNLAPGVGSSSKIAMTAPVTMAPETKSEKIAMTAPVTMSPQLASADMTANRWRVHFVMPSQYTMATIPKPRNNAVILREVPAKLVAVLSFSGFNSVAKVQQRSDAILDWLKVNKYTALSAPQLARYDPPWTLPMLRRNEIMVEVAAP